MIREIVKDEAILSQVCEPVTAEEAPQIIEDLLDTLAAQEDCAGLAANQVGYVKAALVYVDKNDKPHIMLNPVIKRGLRGARYSEMCLSRDEESKANRFEVVTMTYDELVDGRLVGRKKEFQGFVARVIQHMVDHCKGKLV